jgi:YD repeat-containing protein
MATPRACPLCRGPLGDDESVCARCRAPGSAATAKPARAPGIRWRFHFWHLIIVAILVLAPLAWHAAEYLHLRLPLSTSPLVREAVARANDHRATGGLLGTPIRAGWFVKGYIRQDETGWGEARLWIPVSGPKGDGTLYARAGRGSGPWVFSSLDLSRPPSGSVDLLQPAPAATPLPPTPGVTVHLVPMGTFQTLSLGELPAYYRARLGLSVELQAPVPLEQVTFDSGRNQYVAESLVASLKRRRPDLAADSGAVVIGVTEADIYILTRNWRFAFGYRDGERFGVVSAARMIPWLHRVRGLEYLVQARVRKMISRYIGLLAYRLPLNPDPTSLLYAHLLGLDDLDLMQERFEGLGGPAVVSDYTRAHAQPPAPAELESSQPAVPPADDRYWCFLVRSVFDLREGAPAPAGAIGECVPGPHTDREVDELEVDLRGGLLLTRKTDLFVDDAVPLGLTRSFRTWDSWPRAFGLGGNHSYDAFIMGSRQPYTWAEIVLGDGQGIHHDRISKGTGYADAVFEHRATTTAFAGSRIQWTGNGWELTFRDGGTWSFPECYAATRPVECGVIAMRDAEGRVTRFERDRHRNLTRLTSPGGRWIAFEYDASHRVVRATDGRHRAVRYAYDAGGRLAAVTDVEGRTVRYRYDGSNLLGAQDDRGRTLFVARYAEGRLSELGLAGGPAHRFRFTFAAGRPVEAFVTASDGTTTRLDVRPARVTRAPR